jgi:hypothetical protein
MLDPLRKYIAVVWLCGKTDTSCINKDDPGRHYERADAEECVTGKRPKPPRPARPADFEKAHG